MPGPRLTARCRPRVSGRRARRVGYLALHRRDRRNDSELAGVRYGDRHRSTAPRQSHRDASYRRKLGVAQRNRVRADQAVIRSHGPPASPGVRASASASERPRPVGEGEDETGVVQAAPKALCVACRAVVGGHSGVDPPRRCMGGNESASHPRHWLPLWATIIDREEPVCSGALWLRWCGAGTAGPDPITSCPASHTQHVTYAGERAPEARRRSRHTSAATRRRQRRSVLAS